jgi:adenine phosphoribosyltransferase
MVKTTCHPDPLGALRDIYQRARVIKHGSRLTTVNGFTDQSEPLDPTLLLGLSRLIEERLGDLEYDVIAGEEDKGAHIATAYSIWTGKPLTLARWYVYPIESGNPRAAVASIQSEYFDGKLALNGVTPGTRYLLIDDTLSTGGTIIALTQAIQAQGGKVVGVLAVVEKVDSRGAERVLAETGLHVQTLLRVHTTPTGVTVL